MPAEFVVEEQNEWSMCSSSGLGLIARSIAIRWLMSARDSSAIE
jgi:hypothetical protein